MERGGLPNHVCLLNKGEDSSRGGCWEEAGLWAPCSYETSLTYRPFSGGYNARLKSPGSGYGGIFRAQRFEVYQQVWLPACTMCWGNGTLGAHLARGALCLSSSLRCYERFPPCRCSPMSFAGILVRGNELLSPTMQLQPAALSRMPSPTPTSKTPVSPTTTRPGC